MRPDDKSPVTLGGWDRWLQLACLPAYTQACTRPAAVRAACALAQSCLTLQTLARVCMLPRSLNHHLGLGVTTVSLTAQRMQPACIAPVLELGATSQDLVCAALLHAFPPWR